MQIDITPLRGQEVGTTLDIAEGQQTATLGDLSVHNLSVAAAVVALEDSWIISGTVNAEMELECSRCLVTFRERVATPFEATFAVRADEDAFQTDGATLELATPLRESLLLAIPLAPLHDPDCLGLCVVCGKDLNEEPHDHTSATPEKTVD